MFIYLIVLLEGFISVSLEILILRQLMPVVGNSIIVTSITIGIFLLFLAYGYRAGGEIKGNLIEKLRFNFLLASILFGFGLSTLFVDGFFSLLHFQSPLGVIFSLVSYLFLVIAPIIFLLGQTIPLVLSLWHEQIAIGHKSAIVLHVNTIGSFLGATVTAILFLNFFGVASTIVFDFLLLMLLLFFLDKNFILKNKFPLIILTSLVWGVNVVFNQLQFVATNNYGDYQIIHADQKTYFSVNHASTSVIDTNLKAANYIEKIRQIVFDDLGIKNKNILVIGAGGFTFTAAGDKQNHVIYVDIDPQIKDIVSNHFLKNINGKFIADDARHFLNITPNKFDVIISDAYSFRYSTAPYLLTYEYYSQLKKSLAKNGVAIFNIIAHADLSDNYSKRIDNTLRSVFGNCTANPQHYGSNAVNVIYVCFNHENAVDKTIYTDNKNSSSFDYFFSKL